MHRYYVTKLNKDGIMEYPPRPIPDTVGHYGENGIAFEGICGRFYGFVEYEKELPAFDVTNFALVPGPSPSYYPIDEEAARRAHEMMSFRDYQKGSKTWQYRVRVDEASMIADRQKKRIDPMYHEKVDRLLASFSRRLAENLNAESRIGTMCPSVLISGGSNFPVRKKQRQNEASERNMKEYQEIMGLISRICSVGTGGISSDEPQAIEKLKLKLEKLEKHQELMKAANAAIRMKDRDPSILVHYCADCPIGKRTGKAVTDRPLPFATLRVSRMLDEAQQIADRLEDIAFDGQIDAGEKADFENALAFLRELDQTINDMLLLGMRAGMAEAATPAGNG